RRDNGETIDQVELARHLSLCSLDADERAADALQEAGDGLVASAPRSAANRYREALAYLPRDVDAADLHVRLARALLRAGGPSEAIKVCREGMAGAARSDRGRLTRYLATALADTGDYHEAIRIVDAELAAGDGARVVLLNTKALLLRMVEDFGAAATAIEEAE